MLEAKKKILLIENDSFILQIYANKLDEAGFEVYNATDGDKGLRQIQKLKPDLILLGLKIPKKNGFTVLEAIRKDKTVKKALVIVLTNQSQRDDIRRCYNLGVNDYLIKAHHSPDEVIKRVVELLTDS